MRGGRSQTKERAPRFHAKRWPAKCSRTKRPKEESFCGVLDHVVPVLLYGSALCRQLNKEYGEKGSSFDNHVGESKKTVKKYLDQHPRATRIILTDDTTSPRWYQAVEYPIYVCD